MHRSSEAIGAIAAALAKAQVELSNPEKSLTATIRAAVSGEEDRSFRYAPLSSGLEVVRKSFGRLEIATVQTTAIDGDSGLIRLTTILAHSSGEWVSSDWPVCPVSETAAPQRMGAALTYARRYALFTLVGIAGEDDLDAPDLPIRDVHERKPTANGASAAAPTNGHAVLVAPRRRPITPPARPTLAPEEAAALRDRLLAELEPISGVDELTAWARRTLPLKNSPQWRTLARSSAPSRRRSLPRRLISSVRRQRMPITSECPRITRPPRLLTRPRREGPPRRRRGGGTRSTWPSSHRKRASCAGVSPRMPIICASPSRERSGARSATSSRSRSAAFTIGTSMLTAMRLPGGRGSRSTRARWRSGSGPRRGRAHVEAAPFLPPAKAACAARPIGRTGARRAMRVPVCREAPPAG